METVIHKHLKREKQIKDECVRVLDILVEHAPNCYQRIYCQSFDLDMYVGRNVIVLEYEVPYEDYKDRWIVPTKYLFMTDEELITRAKEDEKDFLQKQSDKDVQELHMLAEQLGYKVEKIQ